MNNRLGFHSFPDTQWVECPDECGFEGEAEVSVEPHRIEGECPKCGATIDIENFSY
jgi:hypothetical protein